MRLKYSDRSAIESAFEMGGGTVLDFTNRQFAEFVQDSVAIDIYADKYRAKGDSKAKLLRAFIEAEPEATVARLLGDLAGYARTSRERKSPIETVEAVAALVERVRAAAGAQTDGLSDSEFVGDDADLAMIAADIESVARDGKHQLAIDRLHTLATQVLRRICRRLGIECPREKPLHSLMGEAAKALKARGAFSSEASENLVRSNITFLERFNEARNEKSAAHPNGLLDADEAALLVTGVVAALRFVMKRSAARSEPKA